MCLLTLTVCLISNSTVKFHPLRHAPAGRFGSSRSYWSAMQSQTRVQMQMRYSAEQTVPTERRYLRELNRTFSPLPGFTEPSLALGCQCLVRMLLNDYVHYGFLLILCVVNTYFTQKIKEVEEEMEEEMEEEAK